MELKNPASTETIARRILESLRRTGYPKFTTRPWNMYQPDTTQWWLLPSQEWPAYRHGKVAVSMYGDRYRIGLYVEKGVSQVYGQTLPRWSAKELCMTNEWAWHRLAHDLESGTFRNRLLDLSGTLKLPIRITLRAADVGTGSPQSKINGAEYDHVVAFQFKKGDLACLSEESKGVLRSYEHIVMIDQLKDILVDPAMAWLWLDLYAEAELNIEELDRAEECALAFVLQFKDLFESSEG